MWDAKGHFANDGVDDLQNVSFIKIGEKNEFRMHQLLKVFGRETVNKKDRGDPGKRSRLWDYEDFQIILQENEILPCIKEVKALRVTPKLNQDSKSDCFHWKDFHYLPRLMFLDLDGVDIEGNSENVLPNLVWLHWPGCRKKSQLFAFNMGKLVILDLSLSQVQLSLDDWRKLMQKAKLLKVLNAKGCHFISAALEFPDPVPLERLILESCLLVIPTDHLSTYGLLKLISLNINRCKKFKSLPQAMFPLKELKELLIDETDIETLEFEKDSLPALEILSACKCEDLVDVHSITFLKSLQKITLSSNRILKTLPAAIGELGRLQEMDLSDTLIGELPSSVKDLKNLEVLKMVRTTLEGFPKAIKDLKKLKELDFTNCGSMVGNCNIAGLFSLRILKLKGTRTFPVPSRYNGEFCLHNLEVESGDDVQTAS